MECILVFFGGGANFCLVASLAHFGFYFAVVLFFWFISGLACTDLCSRLECPEPFLNEKKEKKKKPISVISLRY